MLSPEHDGALQTIASRLLPGSGKPLVERTVDGVSTPVFRVHRGGVTLYLRLAESPEANLAPEVLVHGDLDTTHIFHRDGLYSGIIDFGEIRGADLFYDLGHFALHDGEKIPYRVLPSLLTGYGEVTPLPPDAALRIWLWSLLIGVRALARSVTRPHSAYHDHLIGAIRRALAELSGR